MSDHPLANAKVQPCGWCSDATPIVFARTRNAKNIPIEHEPNPDGNVEISWPGAGIPWATIHSDGQTTLDDLFPTEPTEPTEPGTRYMPHHARCAMDLLDDDDPRKTR